MTNRPAASSRSDRSASSLLAELWADRRNADQETPVLRVLTGSPPDREGRMTDRRAIAVVLAGREQGRPRQERRVGRGEALHLLDARARAGVDLRRPCGGDHGRPEGRPGGAGPGRRGGRPSAAPGDRHRDRRRRSAPHGVAQAAPEHGPRDVCVILYANVPVRPPDLTDRAVSAPADGRRLPCRHREWGKHHPWWTVRVGEADGTLAVGGRRLVSRHIPSPGSPRGPHPGRRRRRGHDGSMVGRVEGVRPGPHAFLGADRRGVVNPNGAVIDIDSPIDLIVADTILHAAPTPPATPGSPASTSRRRRSSPSPRVHGAGAGRDPCGGEPDEHLRPPDRARSSSLHHRRTRREPRRVGRAGVRMRGTPRPTPAPTP